MNKNVIILVLGCLVLTISIILLKEKKSNEFMDKTKREVESIKKESDSTFMLIDETIKNIEVNKVIEQSKIDSLQHIIIEKEIIIEKLDNKIKKNEKTVKEVENN
jgi:DNA-binding sugar fermentation-stimulating protein